MSGCPATTPDQGTNQHERTERIVPPPGHQRQQPSAHDHRGAGRLQMPSHSSAQPNPAQRQPEHPGQADVAVAQPAGVDEPEHEEHPAVDQPAQRGALQVVPGPGRPTSQASRTVTTVTAYAGAISRVGSSRVRQSMTARATPTGTSGSTTSSDHVPAERPARSPRRSRRRSSVALPDQPGPGRDVGVQLLGLLGSRGVGSRLLRRLPGLLRLGLRHGDEPRHQYTRDQPRDTGGDRRHGVEVGHRRRPRGQGSSSAARRIAPAGTSCRPVIATTWLTACATSRSRPLSTVRPAPFGRRGQRASATGRRPRRRPAGTSATAAPAARGPGRTSAPWTPARRRRAPRPRLDQRPPSHRPAPTGAPATACTVSAARSGSRTTRVACRSPRSASAEQQRRGRRAAAEHHRPLQRHVVLAQHHQRPGHVGVEPVPACRPARAARCCRHRSPATHSSYDVEQRHRLALERHGQRQPAPRRPGPARRGTPPGRRPGPGPRRTASPRAPAPRRPPGGSPGDSEWSIGSPRTAHLIDRALSTRSDWVSQYSLELVLELEELVVVVGELGLAGLEVDRHVEEPRPVRGVQRGLDRVVARAPRSGAAAAPGACRCCTASRRRGPRCVSATAEVVAVRARS